MKKSNNQLPWYHNRETIRASQLINDSVRIATNIIYRFVSEEESLEEFDGAALCLLGCPVTLIHVPTYDHQFIVFIEPFGRRQCGCDGGGLLNGCQ